MIYDILSVLCVIFAVIGLGFSIALGVMFIRRHPEVEAIEEEDGFYLSDFNKCGIGEENLFVAGQDQSLFGTINWINNEAGWVGFSLHHFKQPAPDILKPTDLLKGGFAVCFKADDTGMEGLRRYQNLLDRTRFDLEAMIRQQGKAEETGE